MEKALHWKALKTEERLRWILLLVIAVIATLCYNYNDLLITARQSVQVWDSLFAGRFFRFYNDSLMASGNAIYTAKQGCGYNFTIYGIMAIWNIPLWFVKTFTNIEISTEIFKHACPASYLCNDGPVLTTKSSKLIYQEGNGGIYVFPRPIHSAGTFGEHDMHHCTQLEIWIIHGKPDTGTQANGHHRERTNAVFSNTDHRHLFVLGLVVGHFQVLF